MTSVRSHHGDCASRAGDWVNRAYLKRREAML